MKLSRLSLSLILISNMSMSSGPHMVKNSLNTVPRSVPGIRFSKATCNIVNLELHVIIGFTELQK